jgi:hypothetical protein
MWESRNERLKHGVMVSWSGIFKRMLKSTALDHKICLGHVLDVGGREQYGAEN